MKEVTIKHGIRLLKREVPDHATFGDITSDPSIKAALETPDNVVSILDGVTMPPSAPVPPGAVFHLQTAANTKG